MNIQSSTRPRILPQQTPPQEGQEQQPPQKPWQDQFGDSLDLAKDTMTPRLAALGTAFGFAMKGNQITESLHPVAKGIGIIGGGLVGAFVGHSAGGLVNDLSSNLTDRLFGQENSLGKAAVAVGLNTAVAGLAGGFQGAALYGAFTLGGAAQIARDDLMAQG